MFLQKEFKPVWKTRHVYWDLQFKQSGQWFTLTVYPFNLCFWKVLLQGNPGTYHEKVFDSLSDAKRYCEEHCENLCS